MWLSAGICLFLSSFLNRYYNTRQYMTRKQLEDYLWGAANILRGMIDAADFKQYIFPLLFFKRVNGPVGRIPDRPG
jgi:hypothetical protein